MDVWRDRLREVNAMRGRSMRNAFVISLRQRFVFTPVSKAANSTAKALLYQAEFRHHGYIRQAERVGELPAIELHDVTTSPFPLPYQLPGGTLQAVLFSDRYYRFAFVREPVERLLSCYLDRIADIDSVARAEVETVLGKERGEPISLDEFLDAIEASDLDRMNIHWQPQWLLLGLPHVTYDDIFDFRNFARDMGAVLARFYPGWSADVERSFSPSRTGAAARVAEFVSPRNRGRIEAIYARDFETFGFE